MKLQQATLLLGFSQIVLAKSYLKPSFINIRGGSSASASAFDEKNGKNNLSSTSTNSLSSRGGSTLLSEEDRALFSLSQNNITAETEMIVTKRDGSTELLDENKVRRKKHYSFLLHNT